MCNAISIYVVKLAYFISSRNRALPLDKRCIYAINMETLSPVTFLCKLP